MPLTNLTQVPTSIASSFQSFLTAGSFTYYPTFAFICTAAFGTTPTVGATYTNNSQTFTVTQIVGTILYGTSSGLPALSGTLTKASGTGDTSIVFSSFQKPLKLKVRVQGAGGGGSGSGTASVSSNGGAGSLSSFASLSASGGNGGTWANIGGVGGGVTAVGSATIIIQAAIQGGRGAGSTFNASAAMQVSGASGAPSPFGGAESAFYASSGSTSIANSGSGGSGGGAGQVGNIYSGCGGGAGGYIEALLLSAIASSFAIVVGTGGTAGGAGTSGLAGGAGATGAVLIEESFAA